MLASDPGACFVLEGYSQGAMATMNALPKLTSAFNAIKAVMVVGYPGHTGGLQSFMAPNTAQWTSKILDICAVGDMVCGMATAGAPAVGGHLAYPMDMGVQSQMATFAATALSSAAPSAAGSGASGCSTSSSSSSSSSPSSSGIGSILPGLKRLMSGMGDMSSLMGGGGGGGAGANTSSSPTAATTGGSACPSSAAGSGGGSASSGISKLGSLFKRYQAIHKIKRLFSLPGTSLPTANITPGLIDASAGTGLPGASITPGSIGATTGLGGYGASLGPQGATLTDPTKGTRLVTWAQMQQDAEAKQKSAPALPPLPRMSTLSGPVSTSLLAGTNGNILNERFSSLSGGGRDDQIKKQRRQWQHKQMIRTSQATRRK